MISPDAATDQATAAAPPAANTTSDTAPVAPPADPGGNSAGPAPAMPVAPGPNATAPPTPPKETFAQGFGRGTGGNNYTTDAQGNVINSAPARMASKGGILGSILGGALEGAVRGAGASTPEGAVGKGGAASAGINAAQKGAKEQDDRARAIAQRNFENNQAATEAKVRQNMQLAETAHITQVMNHEKEMEPGQLRAQDLSNQEAQMRLAGGQQKMLEDSLDFQDKMAQLGIPREIFSEHSPALTAQIPAAVGGQVRAIQNGQRGAGNGVVVYPKAQMDVPLTVPVTYRTYDGALDKDGVPIATEHVMQPDGKLTANDFMDKYFEGRGQLYKMQQKIHDDMTAKTQQADLADKAAQATQRKAEAYKDTQAGNLSKAQAEAIPKTSPVPAGYTPPDNALTIPPAQLAAAITSKGGTAPNNLPALQSTARYDTSLEDYPTRTYKGDSRMTRADAVNYIVQNINPNFKESEFKARQTYLKQFESSTQGEGATRDRLNTAVQHLDLLGTAATAVSQNNLPLINKIANFYGVQTGTDPAVVYKGIANKAAGEMAGAVKGGSGSATDQEIDKALANFDASLSPQQQASNIRTHMQLLQSVENTLAGHFKDTMGQAPEELGHHVLFGENQDKLNKWVSSGTTPTGNASNPNAPNATPPTPPGASLVIRNGNPVGYQTPEQKQRGTYTLYPSPK